MNWYHASPINNLTVLEPRISNHGVPLVYLSKKRENVLVYLSNAVVGNIFIVIVALFAANVWTGCIDPKMRATFATKVYSETKDIYAIKDALHHSTIDTSKHYISDKEARIDAAADAAGKLFK